MPPHNYVYRYERKPGHYVYIQDGSAYVAAGATISRVLKRYTPDRIFYHLKRRGGHVAALRLHQQSRYFSRFDIQDFFESIARTRVARSLREVGFPHKQAFNIAIEGVVVDGTRKFLPYGFRQSPLLATLALEKSHLGRCLIDLNRAGTLASVYMDDILISGDDRSQIEVASAAIEEAAMAAGFVLSVTKRALNVTEVDIFNCHIQASELSVLDRRMEEFASAFHLASEAGQAAIEKYIEAISAKELMRFHRMV